MAVGVATFSTAAAGRANHAAMSGLRLSSSERQRIGGSAGGDFEEPELLLGDQPRSFLYIMLLVPSPIEPPDTC